MPAVAVPALLPRLLPILLVALAAATAGCAEETAVTRLVVHFHPDLADAGFDVAVESDLDSRPTAATYEADGIPHPDAYTAHDQLEDFVRQREGSTYTAASFNSSFGAGYFLTAINGEAADGTTAYWALSINGEPSSLGMSEAALRDGDVVTWTYTLVQEQPDPDPIGVTIDPPVPTRGETTLLTGSVNHPATVAIDGGASLQVDAGRWELPSPPLAHGPNVATLRIEDGVHAIVRQVTFVRLASVTVEAVFTAQPGHGDESAEVWYDPSRLASAAAYEGTGTERATTYSVHDLLVDWTAQAGVAVQYGGPSAFGFSVESIDGVGQPLDSSLPPYWCYTVNGESAALGISLQTVAPGDVVTWEYSTCV